MIGTAEAAKLIGISKPTLYRLCNMTDFPALRFGRKIVIDETALTDWFNRHRGEDVLGGAEK